MGEGGGSFEARARGAPPRGPACVRGRDLGACTARSMRTGWPPPVPRSRWTRTRSTVSGPGYWPSGWIASADVSPADMEAPCGYGRRRRDRRRGWGGGRGGRYEVQSGQRVWAIDLLVLERLRLHVDGLLRAAGSTPRPEPDPVSGAGGRDADDGAAGGGRGGAGRGDGGSGAGPLRVERVELGRDDLRAFAHAARQVVRRRAGPGRGWRGSAVKRAGRGVDTGQRPKDTPAGGMRSAPGPRTP